MTELVAGAGGAVIGAGITALVQQYLTAARLARLETDVSWIKKVLENGKPPVH